MDSPATGVIRKLFLRYVLVNAADEELAFDDILQMSPAWASAHPASSSSSTTATTPAFVAISFLCISSVDVRMYLAAERRFQYPGIGKRDATRASCEQRHAIDHRLPSMTIKPTPTLQYDWATSPPWPCWLTDLKSVAGRQKHAFSHADVWRPGNSSKIIRDEKKLTHRQGCVVALLNDLVSG